MATFTNPIFEVPTGTAPELDFSGNVLDAEPGAEPALDLNSDLLDAEMEASEYDAVHGFNATYEPVWTRRGDKCKIQRRVYNRKGVPQVVDAIIYDADPESGEVPPARFVDVTPAPAPAPAPAAAAAAGAAPAPAPAPAPAAAAAAGAAPAPAPAQTGKKR